MNYYEILGISNMSTQKEIQKHYYYLAKKYHPDKNKEALNTKYFQQISEAYTILSNSKKRCEYDIYLEFNEIFEDVLTIDQFFNIHLTDEELLILHYYYSKIRNSIEFKFLKALYLSLPHKLQRRYQKKYSLLSQVNSKFIDACNLNNNYTLLLQRSLEDVFHNVCKHVRVQTKCKTMHLFITHSDYTIELYNDIHSMIYLKIETKLGPYKIQNYDLHLIQHINLYQYLFENTRQIQLPNHEIYHYSLHDFETYILNEFGLKDPLTNKRGQLYLHHPLNLSKKRLSVLQKIKEKSIESLIYELFT